MQPSVEQDDKQPLLENQRYKKVQTLGKGAFGFVQLAEDTSAKEKVAIKFLARGEKVNKYVERELLIHRILKHPHVIQFREVFLTSEYLCIAMEYASGGTLFSFVQSAGRLKEVVARWFFQQLIIGVDYCHKKGVVNRDIKLENTLLDYVPGLPLPLLKICDFGYSKADFMSAPQSKVGTPVYMAPEVILSGSVPYDGKLADIWSCGVMLYVMLVGQYPFETAKWREVAKGSANRNPQFAKELLNRIQLNLPPNLELTPECRDLLAKLLTGDPEQRLTMDAIVGHRWFQTHLPSNAMTMNNQYLNQPPAGLQTDDQIRTILQAARSAPAIKRHDQDLLDDVIDYEIEEERRNEVPLSHHTPHHHQQQQAQQQQQQQQQHHQQPHQQAPARPAPAAPQQQQQPQAHHQHQQPHHQQQQQHYGHHGHMPQQHHPQAAPQPHHQPRQPYPQQQQQPQQHYASPHHQPQHGHHHAPSATNIDRAQAAAAAAQAAADAAAAAAAAHANASRPTSSVPARPAPMAYPPGAAPPQGGPHHPAGAIPSQQQQQAGVARPPPRTASYNNTLLL